MMLDTSYLFLGFLNFKEGKSRYYLVYRFASKKKCNHFLVCSNYTPPKTTPQIAEFVMIRLLKKLGIQKRTQSELPTGCNLAIVKKFNAVSIVFAYRT